MIPLREAPRLRLFIKSYGKLTPDEKDKILRDFLVRTHPTLQSQEN